MMPRRSSPNTPKSSLPRPLVWALTACLFALALIAVIAVASLAGFDPQELIDLVHEVSSVVQVGRG